jgi:hypothetical protein
LPFSRCRFAIVGRRVALSIFRDSVLSRGSRRFTRAFYRTSGAELRRLSRDSAAARATRARVCREWHGLQPVMNSRTALFFPSSAGVASRALARALADTEARPTPRRIRHHGLKPVPLRGIPGASSCILAHEKNGGEETRDSSRVRQGRTRGNDKVRTCFPEWRGRPFPRLGRARRPAPLRAIADARNHRPVWPKPPPPRLLGARSPTSTTSTRVTGAIINCAILSPG